jgi:hypothetical protein
MTERIVAPRLADIIEAIERIRRVLDGVTLEAFEQNWEKRWLVERGIEIISEASRHLTDDIKERRTTVAKSSRDRQCSSSCLRSRRARCALEACTRRSGGNRKSLP